MKVLRESDFRVQPLNFPSMVDALRHLFTTFKSNFTANFTPKSIKKSLEIFDYFGTQPAPSSRVASPQLRNYILPELKG